MREDAMERFPGSPMSRHASLWRPLVIGAVAVLVLAVVAAAGVAATNGKGNAAASDPNGCPTNKSAKTAPIADIKPPARLQIVSFEVLSGSVNAGTDSFTLKVRIGSTCSVNIKGASVYVTAVPYNQFSIPTEELTGDDGTTILVFHRDANFPASDQQQQLTLFIRATKPGEDPLAGVSTRRLVALPFAGEGSSRTRPRRAVRGAASALTEPFNRRPPDRSWCGIPLVKPHLARAAAVAEPSAPQHGRSLRVAVRAYLGAEASPFRGPAQVAVNFAHSVASVAAPFGRCSPPERARAGAMEASGSL